MDEPLPQLDPDLIAKGEIYVEVYPMKNTEDGATLIDRGQAADFYDVSLRPDDWDMNQGSPYGEWDDLTYEQAVAKVDELKAHYVGLVDCWVDPA